MHEQHLDQIVERLKRIEKTLEQKADLKDVEEESGSSELGFKLKLLGIKVEDLEELYLKLEEVRGEVEDFQGQLADAESRIDDLESEVWS
jgi:predicted  nucleic acid-binding Zn-ribbon protein